jgi:hypothetical protein
MEGLRKRAVHVVQRFPAHAVFGIMYVRHETAEYAKVTFRPYTYGKIDMRRLPTCQRDGTTRNDRPVVHVQHHMRDSSEYEYDFYLFKDNLDGYWKSDGEAGLGYIIEQNPVDLSGTGGDCTSHAYFEWQTSVDRIDEYAYNVTIAPYRNIMNGLVHDADFNL